MEVDYDPPILINLYVNGQTLKALIDSGADTNVLSYEAYEKLKCEYKPTSTHLTSFANVDTGALGITTLCLNHSDVEIQIQFYIAGPNQSNHDMILGRAWMRKNTRSIDWDKNFIHLGKNAKRVTLPMVMDKELKAQTPSTPINEP